MFDSISFTHNGWKIRITLDGWDLQKTAALVNEIVKGNYLIGNFDIGDKLWFNDGSEFLTCTAKTENKTIDFCSNYGGC